MGWWHISHGRCIRWACLQLSLYKACISDVRVQIDVDGHSFEEGLQEVLHQESYRQKI